MADYSNEYAIYARSLLGLPALAGGNVYFVNGADGADGNDGQTPETAVATLERGYALCTANQHDIVALIGDSSDVNLDDTLTWAKNYTHLVGVCAPTNVGQRARIFMDASGTDPDSSPLLDITASGCMFANFYIFHGIDDTDALINVRVTGGRNHFKNVHVAGIGHATVGAEANARSLVLSGAEECLFEDCTIGVDTIARTNVANASVELASEAKRCTFRNCIFPAYATGAAPVFVKANAAASAVDRWVLFDGCSFINCVQSGSGTNMTSAISAHASLTGLILLKGCTFLGVGDIDSSDTGKVYIDGAAPTANTSGLAITTTA